ncbi:hypothetical protein K502DRAFT_28490 [Neoconidiobolus thromboides FSU 785]|nr:hypothetical protein K502DRAFT_28490 [Neoconidiobolus thromboides FSU 785]
MLFSYLGEDKFFEGIRVYLDKYQYSNATTSELWQCLEQASNKPVSEFMDLWTNVAGYPLLSVKRHNNNQLLIEQSRFYSNNDTKDKDTTTLWWIPLLLNQTNSIEVLNEKQMILDIQLDQFIKFNINSIGVYRVCYDEQCLLDLGKQIESGNSLTDSDKIGLLSDVYHTAISGHSSITFYLNFIFKFKNEKNPL